MAKAKLRFTSEILIRGVNPYVLVDKSRVQQLKAGWRRPLPVVIRVNNRPSEPWHINMMPAGNGDFYLYLHEHVRKSSATKVGDFVSVEIEFDTDYRSGPQTIPDWFRDGLASSKLAAVNWHKLPPSRQKEVVRYLYGLKSAAAQTRNLERALNVLSGKDGRFMARSWHNGS